MGMKRRAPAGAINGIERTIVGVILTIYVL